MNCRRMSIDRIIKTCKELDLEFLSKTHDKNIFYEYRFKCLKHGNVFKSTLDKVVIKRGSPPCCAILKLRYSIDDIKSKFLEKKFEFVDSHYDGANKKYKTRCIKHNTIQIVRAATILYTNSGLKCCGEEKTRGENHHCWNSNISQEVRLKNYGRGNENRRWAYSVKRRDGNKCRICDSAKFVCAHHIESFGSNKKLRDKISNGFSMCLEHHNDFHKKYGFGNNTKSQIHEFIENYKLQSRSLPCFATKASIA